MRTYTVAIKATITKVIEVDAPDEDQAVEKASALFTTECDGDEDYSEEIVDWEDVTEFRRKVA